MKYKLFFLFSISNLLSSEYSDFKNYFMLREDLLEQKRNNENEFKRPYIVISLGDSCRTCFAINYFNLNEYSYPLNWLVVPFSGLYKAFETDFSGFFDKDDLIDCGVFEGKNKKNRKIADKKTGIKSIHDFNTPNYFKGYDVINQKFKRRIKRLYDAFNSNKLIYLLRTEITKEEALLFNELINKKFPNLNFIFVVVGGTDEFKDDWNIGNIKNFYFSDYKEKWLNLNQWKNVFIQLGLIDNNFVNPIKEGFEKYL